MTDILGMRKRLAAIGKLEETERKLKCLKGFNREFLFMEGKEYPIYLFTPNNGDPQVNFIFNEDTMPFILGQPACLEQGEDDKHWNVIRDGQVWFKFEEVEIKETADVR